MLLGVWGKIETSKIDFHSVDASVDLINSFWRLQICYKNYLLNPAIVLICNLLKGDLHRLPRCQNLYNYILFIVFLIYTTCRLFVWNSDSSLLSTKMVKSVNEK